MFGNWFGDIYQSMVDGQLNPFSNLNHDWRMHTFWELVKVMEEPGHGVI